MLHCHHLNFCIEINEKVCKLFGKQNHDVSNAKRKKSQRQIGRQTLTQPSWGEQLCHSSNISLAPGGDKPVLLTVLPSTEYRQYRRFSFSISPPSLPTQSYERLELPSEETVEGLFLWHCGCKNFTRKTEKWTCKTYYSVTKFLFLCSC